MSIPSYLRLLIPAALYIYITGASTEGLLLLIIPILVFSILIFRGVKSNKASLATALSVGSLVIYIINYGLTVLDCGTSENWFDLSGCDEEVHSAIVASSVILVATNLLLLYLAITSKTKLFNRATSKKAQRQKVASSSRRLAIEH